VSDLPVYVRSYAALSLHRDSDEQIIEALKAKPKLITITHGGCIEP
jgi:hypothetical protein